ncbi:hypothetical protein DF147_25225 [Burkholderia cenocepacia]|uniref:hypothetical protein n=1 Tax=Burkholderia TaxID=32008 RepID=UPI000B7A8F04|nr:MULTISPECIES: hypothetical protein [unclassified Burkholderia]RQU36238.1 hypothetical protein DF147_25225 [Burkholderia cenocepacia]OXI76154.1 hypothetical protein CFB44_06835 [Burkholderia sp. AU31280]RQU84549.1 hypothetical protein DF133_27970 [Burkholderia cenocepacia]RQV14828.1 hypothetical protein DF132_29725 [Burkholderia cenocepacia]RQV20737.1 hypothetical protein DF039_13010 [Burkholderia cenocepacia]
MIAELVIGFIVGVAIAVPVWIVAQHLGIGRGFHAPRGIDRRDAVPCELVPVALRGRLLPDVGGEEADERHERHERDSKAAR